MKKTACLCALLLIGAFGFAQNIAINSDGTAPDASAILDVKSIAKGLLLPRMTASQRTAIASPATGLLMYQTDGANGFYYNNGTPSTPNWLQLPSNLASWSVNGNAGTNPATNFIGTMDNQSLAFKINNQKAGLLGTNSNTSFGLLTLNANTTGHSNSFFGWESGMSNTSGIRNTGLGTQALWSNTEGLDNTGIGSGALFSNTFGSFNTANGESCLSRNTSGCCNTGIGSGALVQNNGSFNTAIGRNVLNDNTTGESNTATGVAALVRNTEGSYNTANGMGALVFNTIGSANTAMGFNALNSNTTSNANVAIGIAALYSNTSASNLVAIGDSALYNNGVGTFDPTQAQKNTAVGSKALYGNNLGESNTGVGFEALYSIGGGYQNTAVGTLALRNAQGFGSEGNVAVGYRSLFANVGGLQNVAVGKNALAINTAGTHNTAVGSSTLSNNVGGFSNTAVGAFANVATGSLTSATAIGANASVSQSNSIVLGSITGVGTNVGVGTTAPQARMHLKSNSLGNATASQLMLEEEGDDYTRLTMKNTATPTRYWDMGGYVNATNANARLSFYFSGLGDVLYLKGNGNATLAGTLTQLSDARLKTNILPIASSLTRLLQLNGYQYNWKDATRDQSKQFGVLAQEVESLFPELVQRDDKGILSVNYSGLIPVMINAIKEQQTTIGLLEKRLSALEKKAN